MADTVTRQRLAVTSALVGVGALAVVIVLSLLSRAGPPPAAGAAPTTPRSTSASRPPATSAVPTPTSPGTEVPSPTPGRPHRLGTGAIVPVEPVQTRQAVPLGGSGDFGTGVTVRLTRVTAVEGRATAPGEVAGPALSVTVVARNGTARSVDLNSVGVLLYFGADRSPATPLREGTRPVSGALAPSRTATGTYTFSVPEGERDSVRVEISYSTGAPTVAFEGPVA